MDNSEDLNAVAVVEGDNVKQEEEKEEEDGTKTTIFNDVRRLVDKHTEEPSNEVGGNYHLFYIETRVLN